MGILSNIYIGETPPDIKGFNGIWVKPSKDPKNPYNFMYQYIGEKESYWKEIPWGEGSSQDLSEIKQKITNLENSLGDISSILDNINGEII